jgi:hypothetical protein
MKSKSLRDPGDTSEPAQASVIRGLGRARAAVNEIIEGPDANVDAIIRSAHENGGVRSGKRK